MNPSSTKRIALLALLPLLALGCSRSHDHAHDAAKSAGGEVHRHGHVHTAPHGGLLVEVGDHQFNVELVIDREIGRIAAYVLDGHAENFACASRAAA
jgi:hypothetical protein